jgi:hypothetical protein
MPFFWGRKISRQTSSCGSSSSFFLKRGEKVTFVNFLEDGGCMVKSEGLDHDVGVVRPLRYHPCKPWAKGFLLPTATPTKQTQINSAEGDQR